MAGHIYAQSGSREWMLALSPFHLLQVLCPQDGATCHQEGFSLSYPSWKYPHGHSQRSTS